MRVPAPINIRVHQDQLKSEVISMSSPIKLGRGGRARLARLAINHHVVIKGRTICSPRASIIVRVCVRS